MSNMTNIPDHFVTQFDANWSHLVQQKMSRLREYVRIDSIEGKEKVYNQLNTSTMSLITTRSGATTPTDIPTAKRYLRVSGYDSTAIFDEFDEVLLGNVVLPTSQTVESHAAAYARTLDQILINALGGSAFTGDGTTAVSLPSSQLVAVNFVESGAQANSGLTLDKLRQTKYLFDSNEVDDDDQRIIVVSAKQLQNLLRSTQFTSRDWNEVQALVSGKIDQFLGFKFIRSELLPIASNIRTCYAYAKSGVVLAEAGKEVKIDIRADLRHSLQIRTKGLLGGTRLEEKKVVQISCDETA
jgi:hypothetical protein